jgi:hypothetical protein
MAKTELVKLLWRQFLAIQRSSQNGTLDKGRDMLMENTCDFVILSINSSSLYTFKKILKMLIQNYIDINSESH